MKNLVLSFAVSLLAGCLCSGFTQAEHPVPLSIRHLGHTNPNQRLTLVVSLPYRDPEGMREFVDSVSRPSSPHYRHFISPEEVGARFGVPSAEVEKVRSYFGRFGLSTKLVAKNHLGIVMGGSVSQVEATLSTTIDDFAEGKTRFYAQSRPYRLPAEIAPLVEYVSGLDNYSQPRHMAFTPSMVRTLYSGQSSFTRGLQGQGRTVGISSFDGFRLSNIPLFYAHFALPAPAGGVSSNITVSTFAGGVGAGTVNGEGDVDIQMVLGMAPLCNLIVYDTGDNSFLGCLTAEADDNKADIITDSYGWNLAPIPAAIAHDLHLSLSAQGITYMAATGDTGANLEGYTYPDCDPEVLAVGGTVATVTAGGSRISEVGWSGSGGGWCVTPYSFNVLPSWQHGNGVPTNVPYRMFPDLSLNAGVPYQFYLNGALNTGFVGTSFASPTFAGDLAVAEENLIVNGGLSPDSLGNRRLGRLQDLIYAQNGKAGTWFDVTTGSNGRLPDGTMSIAHSGWDMVTGWGAPNMQMLLPVFISTPTGPVSP